jgi:hypothetical protein
MAKYMRAIAQASGAVAILVYAGGIKGEALKLPKDLQTRILIPDEGEQAESSSQAG